MSHWLPRNWKAILLVCLCLSPAGAVAAPRSVQLQAQTPAERTAIANFFAIDSVDANGVWTIIDSTQIEIARQAGFTVLSDSPVPRQTALDFPEKDARYHNYAETLTFLRMLQSANADIARVVSIGKSREGRDLWALHINTDPEALVSGLSTKPGTVYMANHHAREHLTNEVLLLLAQHLLPQRREPGLQSLLEQRDIWLIPMVNPDGVEWDISGTAGYRYWRKNRRPSSTGAALEVGVDLNRNYGYKWGGEGSGGSPTSEAYRGTEPFSEPETRAIRDFILERSNVKVLLSLHTYSELILYPWGYTDSAIERQRDYSVFEKMARTMAQWNHYTPQQSSELYITSGDTMDWAYGERGIFAFTFELSPKSIGGFYPGAAMIDKAFADNLRPALYLLEVSGDPYQVLSKSSEFLSWPSWFTGKLGSALTPTW